MPVWDPKVFSSFSHLCKTERDLWRYFEGDPSTWARKSERS